ncbi:MAG TPA: hypothetical protein VKC65_04845 [Gaiellaceae bacterium]|nr:hypothetical protein [Gaiellaceae bacterium]
MPTAPGPRFVLEAGFLVLLALVVGLADLDPLLIVLVMLVGWILVSLIEYSAWRQAQSAMMRGYEPAFAGPPVNEMAADDPPPSPPPPSPPQPPPDEETVVTPPDPEEQSEEEQEQDAPAAEEPAPAEAEGAIGVADAEERRVAHRLEPLEPRPRRRWIFFGPHERRDEQAEDDSET